MIEDFQLDLVAATWFRVQNDDYVNFRREVDQWQACPERYAVCAPSTEAPTTVDDTSGVAQYRQVALVVLLVSLVLLLF